MKIDQELPNRIADAAAKVAECFREEHMADEIAPNPTAVQRMFSEPHKNQSSGHQRAAELTKLLEQWKEEHPRR